VVVYGLELKEYKFQTLQVWMGQLSFLPAKLCVWSIFEHISSVVFVRNDIYIARYAPFV